jgi:hypothetical protein
VHGAPPIREIGLHRLLGLVNRSLAGIELGLILDHRSRLRELGSQLVRVRVRRRLVCRHTPHEPVDRRPGDGGATDQDGEPGPHEGDAIVSPATCHAGRRLVPGRPAR